MEGVGDTGLKLDLPQEFSVERYTESMLFDLERRLLSISLQFSAIQLTESPDEESLQTAFSNLLVQLDEIKQEIERHLKNKLDRENVVFADFRMRLHDLNNMLTPVLGCLSMFQYSGTMDRQMVDLTVKGFSRGVAVFDPDYDAPLAKTFTHVKGFEAEGLDIQIEGIPREFESRSPLLRSIALSRIVENCFVNAQRHGQATQVKIRFESMGQNRLKVLISDNGVGFRGVDPFKLREDQIQEGHGYAIAHARKSLEEVGGSLYPLDLHAEDGATWVMELPFKE